MRKNTSLDPGNFLRGSSDQSCFCTFQPGIETAGFTQFMQIVSRFKAESVWNSSKFYNIRSDMHFYTQAILTTDEAY